jgi:hypothetical protein
MSPRGEGRSLASPPPTPPGGLPFSWKLRHTPPVAPPPLAAGWPVYMHLRDRELKIMEENWRTEWWKKIGERKLPEEKVSLYHATSKRVLRTGMFAGPREIKKLKRRQGAFKLGSPLELGHFLLGAHSAVCCFHSRSFLLRALEARVRGSAPQWRVQTLRGPSLRRITLICVLLMPSFQRKLIRCFSHLICPFSCCQSPLF